MHQLKKFLQSDFHRSHFRVGAILMLTLGLTACTGLDDAKPKVQTPQETEQVFCAQDVRQCPDGTFVGRTGPTCEFRCEKQEHKQSNCEIQLNQWITQYEPIANGAVPNVRGNSRILAVELAKVRHLCANSPLKEGEAYRAPDELSKLAADPEIVKEALAGIQAGKN